MKFNYKNQNQEVISITKNHWDKTHTSCKLKSQNKQTYIKGLHTLAL